MPLSSLGGWWRRGWWSFRQSHWGWLQSSPHGRHHHSIRRPHQSANIWTRTLYVCVCVWARPPLICIFVFVQTLDLKGREKFLNQVSVQSYMGCAHCRVKFPQGVGGPCFGIARRFLPPGHPLRNRRCGDQLQYPAPEMLGNSHPNNPNPNSRPPNPNPNPNHCPLPIQVLQKWKTLRLYTPQLSVQNKAITSITLGKKGTRCLCLWQTFHTKVWISRIGSTTAPVCISGSWR